MKRLNSLSRRERQMMDIVYRMGRATAVEVRDAMQDPPSYSAVRATLRILEDKDLLRHAFDGKRYVYTPRVTRTRAVQGAIDHLVNTFFEGSALNAVMTLLEQPGVEISTDEYKRMAELIGRARREGR
jgi:predicted transcriptional regulator